MASPTCSSTASHTAISARAVALTPQLLTQDLLGSVWSLCGFSESALGLLSAHWLRNYQVASRAVLLSLVNWPKKDTDSTAKC